MVNNLKPKQETETEIIIQQFKFSKYSRKIHDDKCIICGKKFLKKRKTKLYCEKCFKERLKIQHRNYKKNERENARKNNN
jgi:hypothetical protein